jgi:membrane-associated phospholipid phosphatase
MLAVGFQDELILWLQDQGQWLIDTMKVVTDLGNGQVYVLVAAFLYWCVDRRLGARIFMVFMATAGVNALLKAAIHAPRPYWVNEEIVGANKHSSFGMPSGHSQSAASVLGMVAVSLHRRWVYVAAGVFVLVMGFTRVVLGVHYLSQVLVGFGVGLLVVWAFVRAEETIVAWMSRQSLKAQVAAALVPGAVMILLGVSLAFILSDFRFAASWVENAPGTFSARDLAIPISLRSVVNAAGAFTGFGLGLVMDSRTGSADVSAASWWIKGVRTVVGAAVLVGGWYVSTLYLPDGRIAVNLYRFVGTSFLGLWIAWLAPALFDLVGLGRPSGESEPTEA